MKRNFLLIGLLFLETIVFAQNKKQLTLDDFVVNYSFYPKNVREVNSMNDDENFTSLQKGKFIVKYSYKTGEAIDTVFNLNNLKDYDLKRISKYSFSNNEQRLLIETNPQSIYRRSYTAEYYVWDFYTEELYTVSENGPQQVATFSPDGERVAFVRDNNIYIKTIRFGTEYAVTKDGKVNQIINGIPDWVYEEEFGYNKAFAWSLDSKSLAFVKFNESEVPEYSFPEYKGLNPEKTDNALYPGRYTYKYPKAGEKNSTVTVHIHDVKTKATLRVDIGDETDIYIPRLKWVPEGDELAVFRLNRRQDKIEVLYANPYTGDTRIIFKEINERYIDEQFLDYFTYLEDNEHFVVLSERDGYSHLYLYTNKGFEVTQLTSGAFDVTNFYGYDVKRNVFYYQAVAKSPLQREVYSIALKKKEVNLLTPNLGTNAVKFSKNYNYYLNYFSNSETPTTVKVYNRKGKELFALEENKELVKKLAAYDMPQKEFFSFSTSNDVTLNGYFIKPVQFDERKKYPVIITQYSGPNSQEVADRWQLDWHSYLAQEGFLIVGVDPRGTAVRGEEFRKCTYLQLGKYESDDLVETAKYLGALPFIDAKNIAIWGWSFGGYSTALSLEKGGDLFKAGIAVAPVTNWRFYDTVYTERYMRTPKENPFGYDENSPIFNPDKITANLLLVHGTADDNVHAQNSYEFAEALVQAGVQFDMQIYTNRNHSIYGGNTRKHLFTKMLNFFNEHLK